jgi:type IV secretory pathway VirB10-like protein
MRYFHLLALALLAGQLVWANDPPARSAADGTRASANVPVPASAPVMKQTEPVDDVVLTLPGLPPKPVVVAPPPPPPTVVIEEPPKPDPDRPVLRRPKKDYPEGFEKDSAEFLHQKLGSWDQDSARTLLGDPSATRPAYDDDQTVNGEILAFDDPTGKYKQLELDFDKTSGQLRTVFVYPYTMTWTQVRKTYGSSVRATQANKGRTFYSYVDRRLDVLVDSSGKVISLGMY